ncbi:MAG: DUF296 domain-containing protein [Myxococcales bacterium]|nr:DUF296 domain-containing protein [Myxococcales bacterium]MDH3483383.1 DUF296 domain-containing protein [Myxococcales bacterium]
MTIFSAQTNASRTIVGRVFRGRRLQEALHELVDEHHLQTAWLNALGAFEWIDLTEYSQVDQKYGEPHRFERCELLAMQGNLSERDEEPFWHLHATISCRENNRDVTYGGHVVDGVVFALEFRIDCFDDLALSRSHDEATGLHLWLKGEGTPAAAARDVEDRPITWAMAAEASKVEPGEGRETTPVRGEWLDHPKFGVCEIEGLSGDGVCIIKLPNARRKKIQIGALQVLAPRQDGARKVFPVRPKPKF